MKAQSAPPSVPIRLFSWLFLLFLLIPGACTPDAVRGSEDVSADANLTGTWKVIAHEDLNNKIRIVKDSVNSWGGLDVLLTFEENRILGKNTTN